MSKLQDFIHEQLQASLEFDDDPPDECFRGGIVTHWVVLLEVVPPPAVSDAPQLLALAAEGQRSWTTKGMLLDALDMERKEGL